MLIFSYVLFGGFYFWFYVEIQYIHLTFVSFWILFTARFHYCASGLLSIYCLRSLMCLARFGSSRTYCALVRFCVVAHTYLCARRTFVFWRTLICALVRFCVLAHTYLCARRTFVLWRTLICALGALLRFDTRLFVRSAHFCVLTRAYLCARRTFAFWLARTCLLFNFILDFILCSFT